MVSQFSISRSVWAIFSRRCAYCLALSFLFLNILPKVNLPSPSLELSCLSLARRLMAAYFRTSHDSFSPIALIRAARPIISPLTQFRICLNGFVKSLLKSSSLFFRLTFVSPATSFTWTSFLSPRVTFELSYDSSYFWRKSANCL